MEKIKGLLKKHKFLRYFLISYLIIGGFLSALTGPISSILIATTFLALIIAFILSFAYKVYKKWEDKSLKNKSRKQKIEILNSAKYTTIFIGVVILFIGSSIKEGLLLIVIGMVLLYYSFILSRNKKEEVQKLMEEEQKSEGEVEKSTLFAKLKEYKTKVKFSRLKKQTLFDNKQEEIEEFFETLQTKGKEVLHYYNFGTTLSDTNYDTFYSFINEAEKYLDILCWKIDERLLSEMLWFLKNKNISIKIITKHRTKQGYLTEFKKYCSNLKLEIIHRNKIHAKLIIKDKNELILGSSNFTNASMSKSGYFLDCNIIIKHEETIENAIDLFKSLLQTRDCTKEIQNSRLMYSRNHNGYLPFSLKTYFEKENEEIILLFSCNQVDKRIVDRIIEWNPKTLIKLYVSNAWTTSELSKDNLNSMKWIYESSISNYKNLKIIPITEKIHSKIYLFKSQKMAFISSQNLTVESWQSLLEAGILTNNEKDFKYLCDSINSFKKSQLNKIEFEDLEETSKPESMFSGSKDELSISLPWELPEANTEWKIHRTRNQNYYKLVKHKPKQKNEEGIENVDKRLESSKVIKNPFLEELESKYLSKQSFTGIYSKPTRQILSGKSRNEEKRFWKNEFEKLNRKYEIDLSEEDKKKINLAINYVEKQLKKFENEKRI